MAGLLHDGLRVLSKNQIIEFHKYVKKHSPLDKFVYYVKQDDTIKVPGSLHVATETEQLVDRTTGQSMVIFTSTEEVENLREIDPETVWLGSHDGMIFAFNSRSSYYWQSGLHHYAGRAVPPYMLTQFVDSDTDIDPLSVLSSSMAEFLTLGGPFRWGTGATDFVTLPVYPEFLVPDNIPAPYIAVEIVETSPIMQIPKWFKFRTPGTGEWMEIYSQLMQDKVRLHLYGFNQFKSGSYLAYLNEYFTLEPNMGLLDGMSVKDEVVVQSEYNIRAKKKIVELSVSYQSVVMYEQAVRLIKHTTPYFNFPGLWEGPGRQVP